MSACLKPIPQFAHESSETVIEEILPLLHEHYAEIAHYQDIPIAIDIEAYLKAERQGILRIYTVRHGGELIGYALFAVKPSIKYSGSLQAQQDVLYLSPAFRKGRVGMRFIQWCDTQLKAEGVQVCYQHVKAAHNFGPMLERMGYELIDHIYGRRLDGH